MKQIETINAEGCVLCHDLTQIIKDEYKGAKFLKGHVVKAEDIPVLLSMGKEHLFVFEPKEGFLHEEAAALQLLEISKGENLYNNICREGKIELFSSMDGLLCYDESLLFKINSIGEISIAAQGNLTPVKKGDKIAGMRVVPLMIDEEKIQKARRLAQGKALFKVLPYKNKKYAVIATGSEIKKGLIKDTFSPVVQGKLEEFGAQCLGVCFSGDDKAVIAGLIKDFCKKGADIIVCTGGMSVDPDDKTPAAIKASGASIVTYGAPVLPGAMFLYAQLGGSTVLGLPGCVMYAKRTVLDLVLPRIFADIALKAEDFSALGAGGLCLGCEVCHFPNCGFGKSMRG